MKELNETAMQIYKAKAQQINLNYLSNINKDKLKKSGDEDDDDCNNYKRNNLVISKLLNFSIKI
jgi:hypothetical protein